MAKPGKPRSGSLQFWPRVRAKRTHAKVRSWPSNNEIKPLGFAGYKVGMTHVIFTDNRANSMTKGQDISMPVTIIECPSLKTASIIFYKNSNPSSALMASNLDKELGRRIQLPKESKKKIEDFKPEDYKDIKILVYTQPKLTSIGKKKPELFELAIGGKIEEKYNWAKENLGKEINLKDILTEGQTVDIRSITKGKGLQGPIRRFGISKKASKSEKGTRRPGSLGPWHGARQWRVAKSGQLGFQQRTELNKWTVKISEDAKEINKKGGFVRYGIIKNPYILVRGSIPGASKRLIKFTNPMRITKRVQKEAPTIQYISK